MRFAGGASPWRKASGSGGPLHTLRGRGALSCLSAPVHEPPSKQGGYRQTGFAVHRNTTLIAVVLSTIFPHGSANAQEPYSHLVPRGKIRLEIRGEYLSFSSRYRMWTDGTATREGLEGLSDPFTGPAGVMVFPFLAPTEQAVRDAMGDDYALSLGTMASFMEKNRARVPISLDVGVFDWLTAGVVVPAVQNETEFAFHFEADSLEANAGFGPGMSNPGVVAEFLSGLQGSIGDYEAYREAACASDPDSPDCMNATQVLAGAVDFQGALSTMYGTKFAPLGWSLAGMALQERLSVLAMAFEAAGVTGVPAAVPLADALLTPENFLTLVADPAFGIEATNPLGQWRALWSVGDIELRADARLFEFGEPGGSRHLAAGAGALVRLPTGDQDDPANFIDAATGDAQTDLELRGWLNGRWHGGFGLWADVRYGIQLKGTTVRRVFDPDVTFAPVSSQIELDWDPGDYHFVELAPWYRVAESMTLLAGYRYHRKGRDAFSVAAADGAEPSAGDAAPDPEILVPHSESSSSRFMAGMVYNRDMPTPDGSRGSPLEVRVVYRQVVGGGGGNVPKAASIEAGFRFFAKLWGEG